MSNEPLGALFPWTTTYLLASGKLDQTGYSSALSISLIAAVGLIGFLASLLYFQKEDVK
ncbi:hypothetical protein [Gorillibacterium sp. CAU 1737]|uniref:hypothetical protein n=1 Tax=Gorillibacterium sp. CAU 1737 TaxID=3140362 RepID=UPI00326182E2